MAPVLINCSRSFWGSRSSIGVDLGGGGSEIWISTFPAIKKKKKNHRCRCGTAASWSSVWQRPELCRSGSAFGARDSRNHSAIFLPDSESDLRTAAGSLACRNRAGHKALGSETIPWHPDCTGRAAERARKCAFFSLVPEPLNS